MSQAPWLPRQDQDLVGAINSALSLTHVLIPTKTQTCQRMHQKLEQRGLRQHFQSKARPGSSNATRTTIYDPGRAHVSTSSSKRTGTRKSNILEQVRGNSLETKIQISLVKGRGEKY